MYPFDEAYCLEQFENLLAIDSTTGQFREVQNYLTEELDRLGFDYQICHKGGVIADLGGTGNALAITAHLDDIGLMVRHVNADGTLNVCPVGGLYPFYCMDWQAWLFGIAIIAALIFLYYNPIKKKRERADFRRIQQLSK